MHDSPLGGHAGFHKTYQRVKREFFWKNLKGDVRQYVKECDSCQRNKVENVNPAGLLQPLDIPSHVWTSISMDFIEGLPNSYGKNSIMVVVDRLSKYAHFMTLSHPYTASKIAQVFVDQVFKLHGMPTSIISDRDPVFISHFWQEFFKL